MRRLGESWGMLGNASGKLGEAWGGLGNAWHVHTDVHTYTMLREGLGRRLGEEGLGNASGRLGETRVCT